MLSGVDNSEAIDDKENTVLKLPCIEESAEVVLFNVERSSILTQMFCKYEEDLSLTKYRLTIQFKAKKELMVAGY